MLGVDLNDGHVAAWVTAADGNPVGYPVTIPLELDGLGAPTRDGRLRAAVSELLRVAKTAGGKAVAIEDLDFAKARDTGRGTMGRGRRGKRFRRCVAGIPTARFRDRLVQMAANSGLSVIAVDPAYPSIWGGQHWHQVLQDKTVTTVSRHHAASVVIARRGLGHRARRRCGVTGVDHRIDNRELPARPEPSMPPVGVPKTLHTEPETRNAPGQPQQRHKTQAADRQPPGTQVAQHRSAPPLGPDSFLLAS